MKLDYNNQTFIDYFNYLLNGRWHTGLTSNKYGQILMEELVIKELGIKKTDRVLDFGSGVGLTTYDVQMMTGCQIIGVNISQKQTKMSRKLVNLNNKIFL